jgi:hypothetical protein
MEESKIGNAVKAMNKNQIPHFYGFIPFMIMALPAYGVGQALQPKTLGLSNEANAAIISSILKKELNRRSALHTNAPVLLSTENVATALSTGLTPSNLVILTPARIHEIASQQKGLEYLRFSLWTVKKRSVRISLTRQEGLAGSSTGLVYECSRRLGKWDCRGVEGYNVSSSARRPQE